MTSFILLGVRRLLRSCIWRVRWCGAPSARWAAVEAYGTEAVGDPKLPGGVSTLAITYLNRLSDLLFILTRVVNGTVAMCCGYLGVSDTTVGARKLNPLKPSRRMRC